MHGLANAGGLPIIPSNDLNKRFDSELAKFHIQGQGDSPRPSITISRANSPPVQQSTLKPAPRPLRDSQISREVSGFQMPPMPPIPPSPVHDHHADLRTPGTGKSFATSVFSDQEEGEIQQIDSRGPVVRPALSAVARIPCVFPTTDADSEHVHEHEHDPASDAKLMRIRQLSLISAAGLPMSPVEPEEPMPSDAKSLAPSQRSDATSRMSSDDMHSLHMEMRSRMETPTPAPGGLSTLAWASLVAHAAAQQPRESWMSDLDIERGDEEDEGQGGRGFVPPPRPRRLSDVPPALQPGTPTSSIGAGMYSTFVAPRTAPGDNMV